MKPHAILFRSLPRKIFLFVSLVHLQCLSLYSQSPFDYGWQVGYGYSVGATLVKGDTMYIGGDFDYIGHYTGSLVEASLAGTGSVSTAWPVVNGAVRAMISDGSDGWFIGGEFTLVDGYPRRGLAHITAAKQLDLSWNINVNAGARIDAMLLSPGKDILWVGGTFNSIGGIANNKVAKIDMASKTVAGGWGPGTAIGDNWWGTGTVSALAYYAAINGLPGDIPRLFIGGDFRNASWQEAHLTALDPATGTVISNWKSDLNHYGTTCCSAPVSPVVRSLLVNGRSLFIGGLFSAITDKSTTVTRQSIAKMDVYTDLVDANLIADIIPKNDSGVINCMKLVNTPLGTRIAIGGKFRNLSSRGVQNFTIIDPGFGLAWPYQSGSGFVNGLVVDTTFTPGIYQTGEIYSFDTVGTTVYLAGNFEGIKGNTGAVQIRRNLATLNIQTNAIGSWGPVMQTDMPIRSVIVSGGDIYLVGSFTSAGGWLRRNMAAVDLRKDTILSCNPQPDSYVNAFALSPSRDTLYIGGNFANVAGSQRGYTAAINVNTNALLSWSTTTAGGGGVQNIQLDANHGILYVGGKFTTMAGQSKTHLAALNAASGALITGWTANVTTINGQITPVRSMAMSATGDTLYVGGRFNNIAGQARSNLAAIRTTVSGSPSTATAALLGWNFPVTPAAATQDIGVCALTLYDGILYVGGKFDAFNGNSGLHNLASVNASGASHTVNNSWAPLIEYGGVWCLQPVGNLLYIGGDFGSVNAVTTSFAAALNISDASIVSSWIPYPTRGPGGVVLSLMVNGQWVYLGGNQEAMTQGINDAVLHLATIRSINFVILPAQVVDFSVSNSPPGNLVNWQTNWNGSLIELERSYDGRSFSVVAGHLETRGRYLDNAVEKGHTYFYRLRHTSGGSVRYSMIRSVTVGNDESIFVSTIVSAGSTLSLVTQQSDSYISILSPGGQLLARYSLRVGINTIPISSLQRGLYFYSVVNNGQRVKAGRFLVK